MRKEQTEKTQDIKNNSKQANEHAVNEQRNKISNEANRKTNKTQDRKQTNTRER